MTKIGESTGDENSRVDLFDLAASCLSSTIVAADQITALASTTSSEIGGDIHPEGKKKNARLKIDGSFVTDADMAAQQIIVDALYKVSRGIRIVGEENEEEMRRHAITGHEKKLETISNLARDEILIRYESYEKDLLQRESIEIHNRNEDLDLPLAPQWSDTGVDLKSLSSLPPLALQLSDTILGTKDSLNSEENISSRILTVEESEVDAKRVSVFVDPLDGTNSYAKGDHDPVSILIAIILDQEPCFGVVVKPFGYKNQTSVLDTGCMAIYGGTLIGGAYIAGGSALDVRKSQITISDTDSSNPIIRYHNNLPRAVISKSRSQGIVEDFVTHLGERGIIHPKPLLVSGAGEKSLRIITGFQNEGLWFYPKGGTSLWDVAASDAILRATGGRLTDKYGNDMDYSKSKNEAENKNGVVACYDKRLHAECIRLFLEGSWKNA